MPMSEAYYLSTMSHIYQLLDSSLLVLHMFLWLTHPA